MPLHLKQYLVPMVPEVERQDGMGPTETIDHRGTITENGIEDITVRATSK